MMLLQVTLYKEKSFVIALLIIGMAKRKKRESQDGSINVHVILGG